MFGAVGITQGDYSVTKEEKHRNMFMGREMTEQLPPVKEVTTSGKQLIGGKRTALVVLSCNRPQFLVKTVKEVEKVLSSSWNRFTLDLVLSQDGDEKASVIITQNLAMRLGSELPFITVTRMTHKQEPADRNTAYSLASNHIAFVLDQLLQNKKYDQVILLDVGSPPPLHSRTTSSSPLTSSTT